MNKDLWVFKYTPRTLNEMVLTDQKRELLNKVIQELPSTMIYGHPGTGKGCFMDILIRETGCEFIKINASMETGIDNIREKIYKFATAMSVNQKIVYLNESSQLSPQAQDSLKQLSEDVQKNCRFFFVCNNVNKMDDALKSRCGYQVSLDDPPAKEIYNKCLDILKKEGVRVENKSVIIELIKKLYPDIRRIIGTLQSNVLNNKLPKDISISSINDLCDDIFTKMKEQDIDGIRKILRSNYVEYDQLYNFLYKKVMDDPDCVNNPGEAILKIGEYYYKDYFMAIKEINFISMFFDFMKKGIL